MIEAHRGPLSPDLVKSAMTSTALDMDDLLTSGVFDQGFDFTTGYGLLQADKAVQRVRTTLATGSSRAKEIAAAYPNPFRHELSVLLSDVDQQSATVKLYNMRGELVHNQRLEAAGNKARKLSLAHLPAGLYMLHVQQGALAPQVTKLVKQ